MADRSAIRGKCYYCSQEAIMRCEERVSGDVKLKTCPREVCGRHAVQADGAWKCFGHAMPPDSRKPWEAQ